MAVIKTAFTLTANKSTATTSAGPLSVALSLNASDTLTVDTVTSEIVTIPFTAATDVATKLIDGGDYMGSGVAGTDGGYVYLKNTTASGAGKIYVGVQKSGAAVDLDDDAQDERFCTLERGEFAFFPFDYTMDIYVDASAASQQIEYWIFDRA